MALRQEAREVRLHRIDPLQGSDSTHIAVRAHNHDGARMGIYSVLRVSSTTSVTLQVLVIY